MHSQYNLYLWVFTLEQTTYPLHVLATWRRS